MSGGENPDKAPAKPRQDNDVTIYCDAEGPDMELEFTPQPNGNVDLTIGNQDDAVGVMLHKRDRLHLARKLLEGL